MRSAWGSGKVVGGRSGGVRAWCGATRNPIPKGGCALLQHAVDELAAQQCKEYPDLESGGENVTAGEVKSPLTTQALSTHNTLSMAARASSCTQRVTERVRRSQLTSAAAASSGCHWKHQETAATWAAANKTEATA